MFPPDYIKRVDYESNPDVVAWAKREGKSAATEHDLLRRTGRPLNMPAFAALHVASHILHLLLCFLTPDS